MQKIELLLKRFSKLGFEDRQKKEKIINVIEEELGISLEQKDVNFMFDKVILNISGSTRTEFFLKKDLIEERLENDFNF